MVESVRKCRMMSSCGYEFRCGEASIPKERSGGRDDNQGGGEREGRGDPGSKQGILTMR